MASRTIPLDLGKLEEICNASFTTLARLGDMRRAKDGGRHIFINRGANVLAVAHLDSVSDEFHFFTGQIGHKLYIFNSQLDDRLGVYLILHTLTEILGSQAFDILFTEDEEKGRSTAIDFVTKKQYNWMFSFDRMGTDVVMYQYDNLKSERLLKQFGMTLARGSYSCIADLEHLGVNGYNFGCGYHDNHSELSHAIWPETATMVGRFTKFFWNQRNELQTYTPPVRTWTKDSEWQPVRGGTRYIPAPANIPLPPTATGSTVILPKGSSVPDSNADPSEWETWLAGEQERIAQRAERERQYVERHPEYRSERCYTCVVCQCPKFPEEIQLATMICYSCINRY